MVQPTDEKPVTGFGLIGFFPFLHFLLHYVYAYTDEPKHYDH